MYSLYANTFEVGNGHDGAVRLRYYDPARAGGLDAAQIVEGE